MSDEIKALVEAVLGDEAKSERYITSKYPDETDAEYIDRIKRTFCISVDPDPRSPDPPADEQRDSDS